MTVRTRIFAALAIVVLVPVVGFGVGVRGGVLDRFTAQYQRRVDALVHVIEEDIARTSTATKHQLRTVVETMTRDNRLRGALLDADGADRRYVLEYASDLMRLTGLSMLQLQDEEGGIVSSGHFRNEFDRMDPLLAGRLARTNGGVGMVEARSPQGPFLVLARTDSVRFGGRRFHLVGGTDVAGIVARLAADEDLWVSVRLPAVVATTATTTGVRATEPPGVEVVARVGVPFVSVTGDVAAEESADFPVAEFVVFQSIAPLNVLRRHLNLWLLGVTAATALVGLGVATWFSARISRPIAALADKTRHVNLDRLDVEFAEDGRDEIGALSRLLAAMTTRLRGSAARLRQVERRASIGDVARQVNHDVKNGLAPIRNVLRHFAQVARENPDQLATVFNERQDTLDASVSYLESLAQKYARLSPRLSTGRCDVAAVIADLVSTLHVPEHVAVRTRLADRLPSIESDAVVLRRILENLVGNAVDSLEGKAGTVTISAAEMADGSAPDAVQIVVADSGVGMTAEELQHAFSDFYTTKSAGTGLGLSIVRRLVLDLHGQLRVETEPGVGSQFIIELPASPDVQGRGQDSGDAP
ncbi:MAG: HAMP domain-containing sensor histidine kinase [Gemmatimonadetes bacterium]|nr:HAMP domain-containing sensor histidine kinase [Gemmatimonadota bacterium]